MSISKLGNFSSARLRPRALHASTHMIPVSNSRSPFLIVVVDQPSWRQAHSLPPRPNALTVRAINSRRALPVSSCAVFVYSSTSASVNAMALV